MQHLTEDAFEKLLTKNTPSIYRICRIYAQTPIEPQDLFQEVVYQIWKSYGSFKGNSNISTWIYKIALNVCFRSKKKFQKSNEKTLRFEAIQFIPVATDDETQHHNYKALYDCISKLNEADRSIVILYLEELPYKEIALITGLTENHIAVKMKRIRKLLLDCLTPKMN